jgi:citrate lyase beta subunit
MNAIALGATLYVPALRANLIDICLGTHPGLRSIVVCLEDAVRDDELDRARERLCAFLLSLRALDSTLTVFVRPRDVAMLRWMLTLPGIAAVAGFVLPKVACDNLPHWLAALAGSNHAFMPTIEGAEAFSRPALAHLRSQLAPLQARVTAIRIGGNDILNILGTRRSRTRTAYDGPLGSVIRDVATTFIPAGFAVAAPVFEHFAAPAVLQEEVARDIEHGLLTKTAIHPAQVAVIHAAYRVHPADLHEARALLASDAPAVFGTRGSMCEPATHRHWARTIVARATHFGVHDEDLVSPMDVA